MFNWIGLFSAVGLMIQKGMLGEVFRRATFGMIMIMVMLGFYPLVCFYCFRAYREFKGMMADHGMVGGRGGGGIINQIAGNQGGGGAGYRQIAE